MMVFRRRSKNGTTLEQIAELLDQFELPSFPQVASEALQLLADPEVSMAHVAEVLERDPGLSVHFLRLANSASLGLRSSVDSLDRAVVMLGRNQVESILIGHAVAGSLVGRSPAIDAGRFWETAAMRAVLAAQVALVVDPVRRSEHFTAGLLQDMAIIVLAANVPGYDALLDGWYSGAISDFVDAENEQFGWDHAAVGAVMCTSWNFPENLVSAVATHHDDDDDRSPSQLVAAFHEVDTEIGPASFASRCAGVPELALVAEELLSDAREQVAEVASLFA